MNSMASLVKVLFFVSLFVGLYITLFVFLHLHKRPSFKKWIKDELLVSAIEGDETIELKNIQFKGLNQHTWQGDCQISFEQLCNYPIFPKAPDARKFAEDVNITSSLNEVDGLRLMGFLRPNVSGDYIFLIASAGFAELWLSSNKNWKNATKIAYTSPSMEAPKSLAIGELETQISNNVRLAAGKAYYMEVIYAKGIKKSSAPFIQVAWKRPAKSGFEIIDRTFFLPYTNDSGKAKMKVYDDDLPDVLACAPLRQKIANKYMRPEVLPYLEGTAVNKALEFCEYRPSYLLDPTNLVGFKQYQGVYSHCHKTYSFPYPNVDGVIRNQGVHEGFKAENPLEEQEARSVVNRYMAALEKNYPR